MNVRQGINRWSPQIKYRIDTGSGGEYLEGIKLDFLIKVTTCLCIKLYRVVQNIYYDLKKFFFLLGACDVKNTVVKS